MYEEKNFHFNIPIDKKDYDLIFDEIKRIPKTWNPKKITDLIHKRLSLTLILGKLVRKERLDSLAIFRLRVPDISEIVDENKLTEFSYPPKCFCKMQRCNRSKEQVFYASGDPHTPFLELSNTVKPGTIAYISRWAVKEDAEEFFMRYLFYGLSEEQENYASIMASGMQEAFHKIFKEMPNESRDNLSYCQKLFQELFTSKGSEYYHITSAIVRHMFVNGKKKNPNFNMPLIAYPSVAKNKEGVNYVFRKDFVDDFLYIKYIDKVVVNSVEFEQVSFSPISRGIVVDGKLCWLNFKISVHKIHYESAYVCKDEFPENDSVYINVKVDDEIFSSCPNNKFSLRYYFDKSCFNEALLMEGVKQFPHLALDSDLSGLRDYMVFIPVENELYLNQNFTSEGKIKIVGAPVSYKIEFCQ